jgi:hypothetical protein
MARIFLSYRRQDAPYVAAALKDRLETHFGAESVFIDVDNMPIGVDFRRHIESAVGQCDAMLVLIGGGWLTVAKEGVKNRLFEPRDYVRMEIEAALGREIPVVPVLAEEAEMPAAEEMPESIQDLIYHNAAEIRAGRDFKTDLDRLVDGLAKLLAPPPAVPTPPQPEAAPSPSPSTALVALPTASHVEEPAAAEPRARPVKTEAKRSPRPSTPSARSGARVIQRSSVASLGDFANVYLSPKIPEQKLQNALRSYAPKVRPEAVLLLFDDTVFGGAKDGMILTANAVYWHNIGGRAEKVDFADLKEVTLNERFVNTDVMVNGSAIRVTGNNEFAKA